MHPNFDYPDEDIAILKLKTRLKFGKYVKPACLPAPEKPSFDLQSMAVVSGWGLIEAGMYRKVAIINTSWLEARFRFYRLFSIYEGEIWLWPFKEKLISLFVTVVKASNFYFSKTS